MPAPTPAGLDCRDTLRLEAAMPLYGHELSEEINPFQAGLSFAVDLEDRRFIGCEALANLKAIRRLPLRVGLEFDGKRVPREGYAILLGGNRIRRHQRHLLANLEPADRDGLRRS